MLRLNRSRKQATLTRQDLAKVRVVVVKAEGKTRGRPSVNLSKIRARELALVARRNAPTAMINVSSMPVGNTLERMARRPVANRMPVAKKKVGIHQLDSATDLGLWLSFEAG